MCTTAGLRYCGKFASRNLHIHILYAIYCLLHSPLASFAVFWHACLFVRVSAAFPSPSRQASNVSGGVLPELPARCRQQLETSRTRRTHVVPRRRPSCIQQCLPVPAKVQLCQAGNAIVF